jgi:exopolysaccharide biosynthesis protein
MGHLTKLLMIGTFGCFMTGQLDLDRILQRELDSNISQILPQEPAHVNPIELHHLNYQGLEYKVAKIPNIQAKKLSLDIVYDGDLLSVANIKQECLAAINGSFYNKNDQVIGYLKTRSGVQNRKKTKVKDRAFLRINGDDISITRSAKTHKEEQVLESYPLLIFDGDIEVSKQRSHKDYRSAIGMDNAKNVYFVTTDNSLIAGSEATLWEFADFLKNELNLVYALNLDGGTSSSLHVQNVFGQQGYKGTANFLCISEN